MERNRENCLRHQEGQLRQPTNRDTKWLWQGILQRQLCIRPSGRKERDLRRERCHWTAVWNLQRLSLFLGNALDIHSGDHRAFHRFQQIRQLRQVLLLEMSFSADLNEPGALSLVLAFSKQQTRLASPWCSAQWHPVNTEAVPTSRY